MGRTYPFIIMEVLSLIADAITKISVVLVALSILAKLTPTQEDDKLIEKIRKIIQEISNLSFIPDIKKK